MRLSAKLWADNADLAAAALAHPFVSRLGDGSLPRALFAGYVAQDMRQTFLLGLILLVLLVKPAGLFGRHEPVHG